MPYFGWVSKERIHDTLVKTTQHYKADQHVPMRKHFRSHFPAANICQLSEWYATDAFISDVPAFDDGIPGHGGVQIVTALWWIGFRMVVWIPYVFQISTP